VPFNAAAVTARKVGTATFTATTVNSATLQYSVDGINVTKSIQRQTLRNVNFTGLYLGGTIYTFFGCLNPANNNVVIQDSGFLNITHSRASIHIAAQGQLSNCTFNGTYSQTGRLGNVSNGTYSCTDGTVGTFSMNALEWTLMGMSGLVSAQNQACQFSGYFGGITNAHLTP